MSDLYYIDDGYYVDGYFVYTADATANLTTSASLSVDATRLKDATANLTVQANVSVSAERTRIAIAAMTTQSNIQVDATRIRDFSSTFAANSSLNALVGKITQGSASFTAAFSPTLTVEITRTVDVDLTATTTMTASVHRTLGMEALLEFFADLNAQADVTREFDASAQSEATLDAAFNRIRDFDAAFSIESSLRLNFTYDVSVALEVESSLTANAITWQPNVLPYGRPNDFIPYSAPFGTSTWSVDSSVVILNPPAGFGGALIKEADTAGSYGILESENSGITLAANENFAWYGSLTINGSLRSFTRQYLASIGTTRMIADQYGQYFYSENVSRRSQAGLHITGSRGSTYASVIATLITDSGTYEVSVSKPQSGNVVYFTNVVVWRDGTTLNIRLGDITNSITDAGIAGSITSTKSFNKVVLYPVAHRYYQYDNNISGTRWSLVSLKVSNDSIETTTTALRTSDLDTVVSGSFYNTLEDNTALTLDASVNLNATATQTTSANFTATGNADITSTSTLTARAIVGVGSDMLATTSLTADARVIRGLVSNQVASVTLEATATRIQQGTASLEAVVTQATTAQRARTVNASVEVVSGLQVQANRLVGANINLESQATIDAIGGKISNNPATLTATTTLFAAPTFYVDFDASLASQASVQFNGGLLAVGDAALNSDFEVVAGVGRFRIDKIVYRIPSEDRTAAITQENRTARIVFEDRIWRVV